MMLATIFALTLLIPQAAAAQVTDRCQPHGTQTTPPRYIRVLVNHHIERVRFPVYVARVVSSEWNYVPTQLRMAGAVAVKQYAWKKAMHPRRSRFGDCFDVHDGTRDQIYRVKSPRAEVWAAVRATWNWTVRREGRLAFTSYRTGRRGRCAFDAGVRLYARSATRCALAGWSAQRLLRVYYGTRYIANLKGAE